MHEVTRRTSLALRALRALPGDGSRWSRARLASSITATPAYLPQVVAPLVRVGLIASSSGPQGGYELTAAGRQASVLDVMRAVEGWDDRHRCLLAHRPEEGSCPLHETWSRACAHLDDVLAQVLVRHGLDPPVAAAAQEFPSSHASQRGPAS